MPGSEHSSIVIGAGNDLRGDDAAGLVAARRLREAGRGAFAVVETTGEALEIIEAFQRACSVVIIDAVSSGAQPGTIHRLDARAQAIRQSFFRYSTHGLSVAEAIELAATLNLLPPKVVVYGIEGKRFDYGAGLSQEVEQAAGEAAAQVLMELRGEAAFE